MEESLERLGVEHVDFIQVHDMEFSNLDRVIHETLPALFRIRESGKARFVGITGLPVHLFKTVLDQHEGVDQIQSYCHYCLNDTALADWLPYLKSKNVGIFNSAPLAMRLLSNEGPPDWHPASAEVRKKCAEAARYCREHGADIGKLALQYAVRHPDIHTHIVGTANPERVLQNIRSLEEPVDEALLAEVLRILKPVHNITWPSGQPENN